MHRIQINAPRHGTHAPARINVNGRASEHRVNVEITVDDEQLNALRDSGYDITEIEIDDTAVEEAPAPGDSGDAGDVGAGGATSGGSATSETSDAQADQAPTEPQGATDVQPAADPLDHDGNGAKGGSLPGEQSTATKGARRRRAAK